MIIQRIFAFIVLVISLSPLGNAQDGKNDILTAEERQWLDDHPVIRLAPTPDYRPGEWFDDQGNYL